MSECDEPLLQDRGLSMAYPNSEACSLIPNVVVNVSHNIYTKPGTSK